MEIKLADLQLAVTRAFRKIKKLKEANGKASVTVVTVLGKYYFRIYNQKIVKSKIYPRIKDSWMTDRIMQDMCNKVELHLHQILEKP